MLTVTFERHDFSGPVLTNGLRVAVERMDWRAVGGPWSARLRVWSSSPEWPLLDGYLLRCGVTIFDDLGPAWWGYVRVYEFHDGARRIRVDMERMANDVTVRYRMPSPDPAGGELAWTAPAEDAQSVAMYGRKARVFPMGAASPAQADAYRAAMLQSYAFPQRTTGLSSANRAGEQSPYAILECRGWWETLDWLYYRDPRGRIGNPVTGSDLALTAAGAGQAAAQSFNAGAEGWTLTEIWLRVGKQGLPTDGLRAELLSSLGPPAVVLRGVSIPGAQIPNERGWVRFALPPTALAANTTYYVRACREGSGAENFFRLSVDHRCSDPGGSLKLWNGSAWVDSLPDGDLTFMACGTAEQGSIARRMLGGPPNGCGQFLRGVQMETSFGFDGAPYRDGRTRGRAEIEALLRQGTQDGTRVLARVEPDRWARLYPQPADGEAQITLFPGGALTWRGGRPVRCSEQPAGRWALLGDTGEAVFIETCAWDTERGLYVEED